MRLLKAVIDTTLCRVVKRHFNGHTVPCQNANTVLTHTARHMSNNLLADIELHTEVCIGQKFNDFAFKFDKFFFCQTDYPLFTAYYRQSLFWAIYRCFLNNNRINRPKLPFSLIFIRVNRFLSPFLSELAPQLHKNGVDIYICSLYVLSSKDNHG